MKIKELNIKQDMPPADVAVANMEIEIEALNKNEYGLVKIIHGYGSHGKGGDIKILARKRLSELKKSGKILDYIEGEKFGENAIQNFDILKNFPELILESDLKNYNSGITLVLLKSE